MKVIVTRDLVFCGKSVPKGTILEVEPSGLYDEFMYIVQGGPLDGLRLMEPDVQEFDESTVYGIDCRDGKCEW